MSIKGITTGIFKRFSSIDAGAAAFAFTVSIAGAAATVIADSLLIQRNEITEPIHFLIVGICAFFLAVILYALARRLYLVTDRNSLCTPKESFSFKRMKPRFFLLNWGLILLCWMPWFIARFPGGYIWDTLDQLLQVYGFRELSNHHPVFTTFVFGTFWHVGDLTGTHAWSCALWAILSMSITAATFSLFLSYLRFLGVKKKVVVAATIYFALYIPLPLFAMTIMKDSYFAWGWIPFLICCIEIARTRGQCLANRGILVALFLIGIHLVLTRQTGIYIVVLSLLVLCFLRQKKRSRLSIVVMMVLVLCTNAGWLDFASSALGTTVSGGDYSEEMVSVPSQQVALLVATHSDDLTKRDWDVLEKVYFRPKEMAKDYNPLLADGTKWRWNQSGLNNDRIEFLRWWIKGFFRWPQVYLTAFVANVYPAIWIDVLPQDSSSLILPDLLAPAENEYHIQFLNRFTTISNPKNEWGIKENVQLLSGLSRSAKGQKLADFSTDLARRAEQITLLAWCSKALFSFWLPAFVLGYAIHAKNLRMLASFAPMLICVLTIFVGPIILPRYLIPLVYGAPVFLLQMLLFNRNESDANDQRLTSSANMTKTNSLKST